MAASLDTGVAAPAAAPVNGVPRGPGLVWAAAALVLGLIIGLGIGLLTPHWRTPGDDSAEAGFLRDMSTHHAQAVEMSMIAHAASDNVEIISLSADIATTQHGQIGTMQAWLRDWNLSPTGSKPAMAWMSDGADTLVDGRMPGMASPDQLASLRAAKGKDLDVQFLTLMRQHHLGGIHMAQAVLDMSDNKDVTWLAGSMVRGQQGELNLIDSLLKQIEGS